MHDISSFTDDCVKRRCRMYADIRDLMPPVVFYRLSTHRFVITNRYGLYNEVIMILRFRKLSASYPNIIS